MKNQQIACFVLLLFIVLIAYLAQMSYGSLVKARLAAREAQHSAQAAQGALRMARKQVASLEKGTRELRDYYQAWEPFLATTQSPQATEQRIVDLVKRAGVFTVSQRFEVLEVRDEPLMRSRLHAHITVEDEYSRALNWFGSLEEELPTSRVVSCRVVRGDSGDDIRLELVVDLPIIRLGNA